MAKAKSLVRSSRSAYSMVNCFCGASGDQLAAVRNLFKSIWGVDSDHGFRKLFKNLGGVKIIADVRLVDFKSEASPVVFVVTPPCPGYSTGNPDPQGSPNLLTTHRRLAGL